MKTTTLLAALTLAATTGLAQAATDSTSTPHRDRPAAVKTDKDKKVEKADADLKSEKAEKSEKTANGETFTEKTKHAFHAMGEKIRGAGHKIAASTKKDGDADTTKHTAKADKHDARSDTRSMGNNAGDSRK